MARRARKLDGANVLYHYLQHSLRNEDVWLFQMLVARLVVSLGIWFPVDVYRRLPVALPFVVRDPKCRRPVDEWGAPDASGYFRDDNTMVKNLKSTLIVGESQFAEYQNRKLGNGFIAAHVWRETTTGELATRSAVTNSFLPNLVWLPSNVARLTDIEGSFAQTFVQAISSKIYRSVEVHADLEPFVRQAWDLLPAAPDFPEQALPALEKLNFFDVPETYIERRVTRVKTTADALACVAEGRPVEGKVISGRYTDGLQELDPEAARELSGWLSQYAAAVAAANSS